MPGTENSTVACEGSKAVQMMGSFSSERPSNMGQEVKLKDGRKRLEGNGWKRRAT